MVVKISGSEAKTPPPGKDRNPLVTELHPLATPSTSRDSTLTPHPPAGLPSGDPLAGPPSAQVRRHQLPELPQCEPQRDRPREGGPCGGRGTLQGPAPIPAGLAGSREGCSHSPQVPAGRAGRASHPQLGKRVPALTTAPSCAHWGVGSCKAGHPLWQQTHPSEEGLLQSELRGEAPAGQAQVTGPSWLLMVGHREGGPERSQAAWVGGAPQPRLLQTALGKVFALRLGVGGSQEGMDGQDCRDARV